MKPMTKSCARGLVAATALLAVGAPVVNAEGGGQAVPPVRVVADGLEGPFGLGTGGSRLYVAESGDGLITQINPRNGRKKIVARVPGAASVDRVGRTLAFITGGSDDPAVKGDAMLYVKGPRGGKRRLANLERYELRHNPDGQTQFHPRTGAPLDALSNPFAVLERRGPGFVFVADAGANAVLSVSRSGKVSTFFVPPLVTTGACKDMPNNHPSDPKGCDSVPTGLAYGPKGRLYVSTLSAEVPGQGRVYVLNGRTGKVLDVIGRFNGPTGVAVSPNGTVYVSELLHNAPEGPPPPGFDPSEIGRIVRVARDGTRSYAGVGTPVGLTWYDGGLYSTSGSVLGLFLGIPDAGQVVAVRQRAFR